MLELRNVSYIVDNDGESKGILKNVSLTVDEGCTVTPEDIRLALEAEGIEARPIWKPMHMQPVFAKNDFIAVEDGDGVGGDIFRRGLCLPSDIKNTAEDMERIISIIKGLF